MRTLAFFGHSDDTACWTWLVDGEEEGGDSHDDSASHTVRAWRVEAGPDRVDVVMSYAPGPGAVWSVGLAPADEDVPIPQWAQSPKFETRGYSVWMILEVPDLAEVRLVTPEEEEQ